MRRRGKSIPPRGGPPVHRLHVKMTAEDGDLLKLYDPLLVPFLRDRRVVVTGAARGVGRILCLLLALHGAHVAAGDIVLPERTREECKDIAKAAIRTGLAPDRPQQIFLALQFDASVPGSSKSLVEAAHREMDGLDRLILNHTLPEYSSMLSSATDLVGRARKHVETNFMGYVEAAVAALPLIRKSAEERTSRRTGLPSSSFGRLFSWLAWNPLSPWTANHEDLVARSSITAISSLSALVPFEHTHGYAASKAAISSWFGCLALELETAKVPVSVSVVTFAAVRTQVLVDALVKTGNTKALAQAADPDEAAMAVIRATCAGVADSIFPSTVGVIRTLYAVAPRFARWLIGLFNNTASEPKAIEGSKQ